MFCKNCGKELEEGALFCAACGAQSEPLEGEAAGEETAALPVEEETENAAETQQRFCPNCGCENDEGDVFCRECGMSLDAAVQGGKRKSAFPAAVNKKLLGRIALGVAFLAALVLVIWGVGRLVSGGLGTNAFVIYDKENELTVARANKFEPITVGGRLQEYEDENGNGEGSVLYRKFRYSEDSAYLYYPQKSGGFEYDLYRKEMAKKKDTGTKLVSKIYDYTLINEDDFVYLKDMENRKLYLYHKSESEKLASDVYWYQVSENGKYILWLSERNLRAQAVKPGAAVQKLDSDVTAVVDMSDDLKTIVYEKDEDLYIIRGMEEPERIATDVKRAYVCDLNGSCKIYYMKSEDASAYLEPEESLGAVEDPVDPYETAAEAPPAAAPFDEAPAAETEPYDDGYYEEPEEVFASEFFSYYDLIEDDLLAQDREIHAPRYEDYEQVIQGPDGEEIRMDEAAYDEDWQIYEEKQRRNNLRRSLVNTRVGMTEWEVFYYEDSTGKSSQALTVNLMPGMNIYGNLMEDEAVLFLGDVVKEQAGLWKLSEVEELDAYEIQKKLEEKLMENARLMYLRDGQVNEVERVTENNICYGVHANKDQHMLYLEYYEDDRTSLYRFDYRAKEAAPVLISDEVQYVVSADMEQVCYLDEDNTLFYGEREVDEESGYPLLCDGDKLLYLVDTDEESEGTLKLFEGGEQSVEIEENVLEGSYGMFDGEHVAYITDYSHKREKGDLGIFAGKKTQIIDTDVNQVYFPQREPNQN